MNNIPELKKWLDMVHSHEFDFQTIAEATSFMGISRFIVPALYEGLIDEVILVVPSGNSKKNWLPEEESAATITVGITDDGNVIGYWSEDKTMQDCTSGFCRKEQWIKSNPRNMRTIKIRFTSPENISSHPGRYVQDGSFVLLSLDADMLGTYNLKQVNGIPSYSLMDDESERILESLHGFYEKESSNVKAVFIANSPNFSREIDTRKPAARMLNVLDVNDNPPDWAAQELNGLRGKE
jgi:hypothetical protein